MIVNLGGRGSCRATALRKRAARQEPRPPGIALRCELPKSETAPDSIGEPAFAKAHLSHLTEER
jgi:hypothetical protein